MNISVAITQTVSPANKRWESFLLIAALLLLVMLTGSYAMLFGREDRQQVILDWQLSAYSDLQDTDQAIYNELLVAVNEITFMQQDSLDWPSVDDLRENWLPPFYQDSSWINRGSVNWQFSSGEDRAVYFGNQGQLETQGAYLLILNNEFVGTGEVLVASVWWHPQRMTGLPQSTEDSSLILAGWKEVVPYQGLDERERLSD
ncbi:MAG: hypothetical protein CMQ38_02810 [Gammaproteobacteria bacterium]|nr:hypothetical protein [Gammaproteobacteria bacterium]|tara:strand:- start:229 stop:834 length:606 start_codon:yes stop_codon:yes gene_type:complete